MRSTVIGATRTATVVSGLAFAAIVGSGTAQADAQDCVIQRDVFSAAATCHDADASPGREYVLIVECWGVHGIPNAFPLYAIGPYSQSSRSFVPTGQGAGGCSTNWGAPSLNAGVIVNARVEIYRQ
ncbi:hypothetical protein [Rhodococcus sp. ARC_M6]|uniref:hypothetical protein n=1 Tax=Rhodococcus sp. ARC_M6 TaxID=2928852 RepID=UPI001FB5270F|nr:hypothetical protein [Rhodococcus sp. ARC_M6]MCJ0903655.1 hypothetical protein [Rhodococcus sp. ARC_M6]